jgi:hypothetical protein
MSHLNMNRLTLRIWLALLPWIFIAACSKSNASAPLQGMTHEPDFMIVHSTEARADLDGCTSCHGADFQGSGRATNCLTCHDQGPSFAIHALPYKSPGLHGTAARDNMIKCLNCHGTAPNKFDGGIMADPALYNNPAGKCSATECHPAAGAHPTNWIETDDSTNGHRSTHATVSFLSANCNICHDYTQGRTGPNPSAPSCFSAKFTNADGITTSCHAGGIISPPHALPYTAPGAHGAGAKVDLSACQECHGTPGTTKFDGGIAFTRCSTAQCHPAAGAHPTNWLETDASTNGYRSTHINAGNSSSCTICHDYTKGRTAPNPAAPSCFSTQFLNADGTTFTCHPNGFSTPNHVLPYTAPESHGATAKSDLTACQQCHGTPGTIQFNGGIAGTSCSTASCHPAAGAHPTNWQGSNDTGLYISSHRTAGNRSSACSICHDYTQGRTAPNPSAPSCFSTQFTNADGSTTSCHPSGPITPPHSIPYTAPEAHGTTAKTSLAYCQQCHGVVGTTQFTGGSVSTSCSSASCHPAAGAHPTRWQGTNDITTSYASTHRTAGDLSASCSICHDYTQGRTAPNQAAPSCYSAQFTNADGSTTSCHPSGWGAPHAIPYTSPETHGADAKPNLLACQQCHGTPGTTLFNGGTASTSCSSCHTAAHAHPTRWQGNDDNTAPYISTHRNSGNRSAACSVCHDYTQGRTAPDPSAPSCFTARFTNADGVTSSCHGD